MISKKKHYNFYSNKTKNVAPINEEFSFILNQYHLYDLLSNCWCAETCAPRMRQNWSKDNITLGQCSITSFLAQDIFGGEVYAIILPNGDRHCYNKIGDVIFDLTSEQFGETKLKYECQNPQSRDTHFNDLEKLNRYALLKEKLLKNK